MSWVIRADMADIPEDIAGIDNAIYQDEEMWQRYGDLAMDAIHATLEDYGKYLKEEEEPELSDTQPFQTVAEYLAEYHEAGRQKNLYEEDLKALANVIKKEVTEKLKALERGVKGTFESAIIEQVLVDVYGVDWDQIAKPFFVGGVRNIVEHEGEAKL